MSGIFINKKTHQIIELAYDKFAHSEEILSRYLNADYLPEGVQMVAMYVNHDKLPHIEHNIDEWESNQVPEGMADVTENLVLHDHGGLSVYSLTLESSKGGVQGWDRSSIGYVSVRADTKELAKQHLDHLVEAWDDFLVFGKIEAFLYESAMSYALAGEWSDSVVVDSSELEENQTFEAAQCLGIEGVKDDWVKLYLAGSDVLLGMVKKILASKGTDDDTKWGALVAVFNAIKEGC